jgi:threonine aldolase
MNAHPRHFASDNYAGICPEVMNAIAETNQGHAQAYGEDEWTTRAADLIREVFETRCEVFFVFNGTAANCLSLSAMSQSYHSILCHEYAHIETDECGGPEFFSNGTKILLLKGENGKIPPDAIEKTANKRTDVHFPKPRVVSVTQATEAGTVYSPQEIHAIAEVALRLNLRLHMDGARFANAVASLNVSPKEITWKAGVDVLSLGGTKIGSAAGEAVVFFNLDLAHEFEYRVKQAGQLASKMRFLAAPWVGLLKDQTWIRHARHANQMAELLERLIRDLPGARLMFPRQANAVFVQLPQPAIEALRACGWRFYTFIGEGGCRLMTAWDHTEEDVHRFASDISELLISASGGPK